MCFVRRGSVTQLVLGAIVSTIFFGAATKYQPYKLAFNNRLKTVADAAITITFMVGILLNNTEVSLASQISETALGITLIGINIVVPLGLLAHHLVTLGRKKNVSLTKATGAANSQINPDENGADFELEDNPIFEADGAEVE